MDFGGALTVDGSVTVSSLFSSESESSKQRGRFGSVFSPHGSCDVVEKNESTRFKMANGDYSVLAETRSKEVPCFLSSSCSHSLFPDEEKMLSFSSTKPNSTVPKTDWALQFYHNPSTSSSSSAPLHLRTAGMEFESSNVNTLGIVTGMRGPFSPSQSVELERQALIYKYIHEKVPIPSSLLTPIRRILNSSVFPVFSVKSYNRSASKLSWGSFHPGFFGNSDPELGRCRRTDGKKWRCSRDAVSDQKYCERHLNRVRHRSRKHVEGHNGHATKAVIPAITYSQSASAASGSNTSINPIILQQQRKSFQPSMIAPSPVQLNISPINSENTTSERVRNIPGLSMQLNLSPDSTRTLLPVLKQQNPFEGTLAPADFGLICTDSIVIPQRSSYSENNNFAVPNIPSDRSTMTWSDVDEMQSDKIQLSISIPISLPDISSSSLSNHGKHSIFPHRLSSDFNTLNDGSQRYSNWVPNSWETSFGGPLGEVVTNNSITSEYLSRNLVSSSSLNFLTDGWSSSPVTESSPTGVLQKTAFGSLSSSAGSSPRPQIEHDEGNES